jgi:glutamate-1-semialdehyde 2,1-aminomutase
VPLHDIAALEEALKPRDVAAVILEADGPLGGTVPVQPGYNEGVRDLTRTYGSLLIFDEVVTGFRMAPGGAQEYYGVTPDIATFAKAICGGLPGGAVAGSREVMSTIAFRDDADWNRRGRVRHMGTFSANPVTAAAGVVATRILSDGSVQDHCARMADRLKSEMNGALAEAGVNGCVYGTRSTLRIIVGDDLPPVHDPAEFTTAVSPARLLEGTRQPLLTTIQSAQLVEGLDILGGAHFWTSLPMSEADIDEAVLRFARSMVRVVREGYLKSSRPAMV